MWLRSVGSKNVCQFADGVELSTSDCGEGRSRRRVFECMDEIKCSLSGGIGRRGFGHGAVVWKKFDSLGDALGSSCGDVDTVAPIMLRGSANVPAVNTMWIPGAPVGRCFVDKDFDARRCKRGAIVVESSIELSVRRESGVDARRSQEVECRCRLLDQPTPKVHGKVGVDTGESSNEVAFPDVDGFFGSICSVHVWRC